MESRSGKATRNIILEISSQIVVYFFQFVVRTVFIHSLGEVYLGINGVLTNILSMLSLSELGFSTAFAISLYGPLCHKDYQSLSSILRFFKKVYLVVGLAVFLIGICILPFLPQIINAEIEENITAIYILFLTSSCVTYFSASYTTFITADQKGYVNSIIKSIKVLVLTVLQVVALLNKNYYFYLVAIIVSNVAGVIICYLYFNKQYKHIQSIKPQKIDPDVRKDIIANTRASFFHKLGGVVLASTDNIIISAFISVSVVGYYSNYVLVFGIISTLLSLAVNALAAFVGEINVVGDISTKSSLYWRLSYINYIVTCFSTIMLFSLINPFIYLWAGERYVLPLYFVIVLVVQFYINSIRRITQVYNMSLGLYAKYQYIPLIEAMLNIGISILLVRLIGLVGVILGTIISVMICTFIAERHVLLKYAIEKDVKRFFVNDLGFTVMTVTLCVLVGWVNNYIEISESTILNFSLKAMVDLVFTIAILFLGMNFNKEGKWWINYGKNNILKRNH